VMAATRDDPGRQDMHLLARMLRISMLAFMSGGLFLSLAYFDLSWHIMAITVAMHVLSRERSGVEPARDPEPASSRRRRAMGGGRRYAPRGRRLAPRP